MADVNYRRQGDMVKVKIIDQTGRKMYKDTFPIKDKQSLLRFIGMLEKTGGFSLYYILKEKLRIGEWV